MRKIDAAPLGRRGVQADFRSDRRMGKVTCQLEGAACRLALRQALGTTSEGWSAWAAPDGGGLVTCIATPPGETVNLIELARRGAG